MSHLSQFILGLSLGFGLLAAAAVYLSTSAWFLWGLFPEGSRQVFVETGGKTDRLLTTAESYYHLADRLPFDLAQTRRFVYAVSESQHYLVIVPAVRHGREIRSALARGGWNVQRAGFLLVASYGRSSVTDSLTPWGRASWRGFKQVSQAVVWQRLPFRPIMLATAADSRLVASGHRDLVQVSWQSGSTWPKAARSPRPFAGTDDLLAVFPGQALALLPPGLPDAWNVWLAEKLHLSHTQPAMLAALAVFDRVAVESLGDTVTVGTLGAPDKFLALAEVWLSQEMAAAQPVTVAFRLPDGTLGYEKQPGPPPVIFGPAGADGCSLSRGATAAFRLCHQKNVAWLTTSSQTLPLAKLSRLAPENSWYLEIGPALTGSWPGKVISHLRAFGDKSNVTLELEIQ